MSACDTKHKSYIRLNAFRNNVEVLALALKPSFNEARALPFELAHSDKILIGILLEHFDRIRGRDRGERACGLDCSYNRRIFELSTDMGDEPEQSERKVAPAHSKDGVRWT